ncbi:MAG: hypothetical protein IH899_18245 [Planctomycetes bacterium]|nr:hypothetical protein [Planctomycetota bacterium]
MEFIHNLSDDQIALTGCVAALILSGMMTAAGHTIGRLRKPESARNIFNQHTLEMNNLKSAPVRAGTDRDSRKKAA